MEELPPSAACVRVCNALYAAATLLSSSAFWSFPKQPAEARVTSDGGAPVAFRAIRTLRRKLPWANGPAAATQASLGKWARGAATDIDETENLGPQIVRRQFV